YEASAKRLGYSPHLLRAIDRIRAGGPASVLDAGRPPRPADAPGPPRLEDLAGPSRLAMEDLNRAIEGEKGPGKVKGLRVSAEGKAKAYLVRGDLRTLSRDLTNALEDYAMARLHSKEA